jgi:hypothetical protein
VRDAESAANDRERGSTSLRIAASSFASAEVHLNSRRIGNRWSEEDASLSRVAITDGQPHARGRKVDGGLNAPLTARALREVEESLSVDLVPESQRPAQGHADLRGVFRRKWGRTELSAPWRIPQP